MGKRKREIREEKVGAGVPHDGTGKARTSGDSQSMQLIVGSYEHVLQGIVATVQLRPSAQSNGDSDRNSSKGLDQSCTFADSFLVNAHTASIRSVAVSPESTGERENKRRILATGGNDERINLYSLSTTIPRDNLAKSVKPQLPQPVSHNPDNREMGSLLHHSAAVTALHFPNKSKLISASEDNTIAISRTRDWTVLSTIKTPRRKALGQPSGDTSTVGDLPSGTNDFAVHPSSKLMISVGRGERCMRLWNLVTGKKAGVLSFDRDILRAAEEARYSSGEGRKIVWNRSGTEFAVAFERGIVVFGLDCMPRCRVVLPRPVKVHQIRYVSDEHIGRSKEADQHGELLAFSTENGRVYFADTAELEEDSSEVTDPGPGDGHNQTKQLARCKITGWIGRSADEQPSRIKDFFMLDDCIVAGCSDGRVGIWKFEPSEDIPTSLESPLPNARLIGQYETGLRITCLTGFQLHDPPPPVVESVANGVSTDENQEWAGFDT